MIKHENNIKTMIDKSGLKQTFIADRLGFHPADISHWVSGRRLMGKVVCRDMAELLNCKMSDLYPNLSIYKDSHKNKHLPFTISNLLDFLGLNYLRSDVDNRLGEYDLSINASITDRKFFKLRTKMKGIK